MEVGGVRCSWQEGHALIFDDTYPHYVNNDTSQERAILLFDFPRPMKSLGRIVRHAQFSLFRRSPYVRDARRNEAQWEERIRDVWT